MRAEPVDFGLRNFENANRCPGKQEDRACQSLAEGDCEIWTGPRHFDQCFKIIKILLRTRT